ncbi:hypothetical protein Pmani_022137 [Petrolisthes manimaculis]|uniref:Uncharacterized protein n=1 Tax=Petrolisthes manimaculis TaxID=1843537 RepID=A0AAE1PEF8_9EUCA|nr:hypothetical protein Pmani_022137 [Petrolisthes manimaculis]
MVLVTPAPRVPYPVARLGTGASHSSHLIIQQLNATNSSSSRNKCISRAQASGGTSMWHGQPRDDVDLR